MRYENEEKEVRFDRIHTWDLLEEVDKLLEHIPEWKKFNWSISIQQQHKLNYRNKPGYIPWNKKGN